MLTDLFLRAFGLALLISSCPADLLTRGRRRGSRVVGGELSSDSFQHPFEDVSDPLSEVVLPSGRKG